MASGNRDGCLDIVKQERESSRMTSSFWFENACGRGYLGGHIMRSVWDVCVELPLKHTHGEVKWTARNTNEELNLRFISIAIIEGMGVD